MYTIRHLFIISLLYTYNLHIYLLLHIYYYYIHLYLYIYTSISIYIIKGVGAIAFGGGAVLTASSRSDLLEVDPAQFNK